MSDSATIQAYTDTVEVTIARGVVVRGRCLELSQALELMDLMTAADRQESGSVRKLLSRFVEMTGTGDARVSLPELIAEVIPGFLAGTGLLSPSNQSATGVLTT